MASEIFDFWAKDATVNKVAKGKEKI